jgi:hypothetical protein
MTHYYDDKHFICHIISHDLYDVHVVGNLHEISLVCAMTAVSPEIQRLVQQLQGTEEEKVVAAKVLARLAAEASEVSEAAKDEIHLEIAKAGGIEPLVAT